MAGGRKAVTSGHELRQRVATLGRELGLDVREEVVVGRRIWGAKRAIDVVVTRPSDGRTLGIECKYQASRGSTDEKLPATILDIAAWPIPGLVVYDGDGWSPGIRSYLDSTGKAVTFNDLASWVKLYFGLR